LYRIHWEQLEQLEGPDQWPGLHFGPGAPPSVQVRRIIHSQPNSLQRNVRSAYKSGKGINILLVIARRLDERKGPDWEDVSPAIAYRSIMSIRSRLHKQNGRDIIHVEVVRPGSFEALQEHLERKTAEKGLGYFHMVHFDLHGEIRDKERPHQFTAYLRFSDHDLNLENVQAKFVAELLRDHGISCAVLTACQSGNATRGDDANLCRIFEQQGVTQILAISFGIHSEAVEIVCNSFYNHLFIDGNTFSEAASKARKELHDKPRRFGKATGKSHRLMDWFIPVTYVPLTEAPIIPRKETSSSNLLKPYGYPLQQSTSMSSSVSNTSNHDWDVEIDIITLKIENFLLSKGSVLVSGPEKALEENSSFVDDLLKSWIKTNFIKDFESLDLSNFMGGDDRIAKRILGRMQEISSRGLSKKLKENYITSSTSHKKALRKAAIKLTGLDSLFPSRKEQVLPEHEKGRQRFQAFLDLVVIKPSKLKGKEYMAPFVILVGRQEHYQQLIDHYSDLGAEFVFRNKVAPMF